ncbi:MAG: Uma2 family endonuclease [Proteobacteria bacterium]|nr:Uma2 family endonuclease [Pseudomonadota bacterium]
MRHPTHSDEMYLAPGAESAHRMDLPGESFPPPDEHLVEPETDREMIDGQIIQVSPANPPHADRTVDISYVLRANVAPNYVASADLLTRVSDENDFATDACIRKAGTDAQGHRHLEELSFEVKHTQSESSLKKRARMLVRRGVRRVFAVYVRIEYHDGVESVKAGPVKEWSRDKNDWEKLDDDYLIKDPCLRQPIEVRSLLDAVQADNAVARALIDKHNPVIAQREAELIAQEHQRSVRGERQQAVRDLCRVLAIKLTPKRQQRIDSLDPDGLHALRTYLLEHRCWDEE